MGFGIDTIDPTAQISVSMLPAFESNVIQPFGIVTGAAYADLDAMGTVAVPVVVPLSGKITGARYFDIDKEGLRVDFWVCNRLVAAQTDNAAFSISDEELVAVKAVIPFADFSDAGAGYVSVQTGLDFDYAAPLGLLYVQVQARGALNIAAAKLPQFQLIIRPDKVP